MEEDDDDFELPDFILNQAVFGLVGKNFVMITADTMLVDDEVVFNNTVEKLHTINDSMFMACIGEPSDTMRFCDYMEKTAKLYSIRHGYSLSAFAMANSASLFIQENNKCLTQFYINTMFASWEKDVGPSLYFIDCLGGMVKTKKVGALSSIPSELSLGILDDLWFRGMDELKAYEILKECVETIADSYIINLKCFSVKVVDENGVRALPNISLESLVAEDYEAEMQAKNKGKKGKKGKRS